MNEDKYAQQPHAQNEAEAASDAAGTEPCDLREQRRQRIEDHLVRSLANPDPLAANIGAANTDLMGALCQVGQAFQESIVSSPVSLETIDRHSPVIDLMVRLTKTIAQVSQLEWRFKAEKEEVETAVALHTSREREQA